MRNGESNYHVGDVVCKVNILLWSGRGIASYAINQATERYAKLSDGRRRYAVAPPYRLITDSGSRCTSVAARAHDVCMCLDAVSCLESRSPWVCTSYHHSACSSSPRSCRTLSAGPRTRFGIWPNTRRLTALCNRTAWCHDNRLLK